MNFCKTEYSTNGKLDDSISKYVLGKSGVIFPITFQILASNGINNEFCLVEIPALHSAPMPECNRPLVRIPTETLFAFRLPPIYAMRLIRAARQYGFELLLRQSLLELQQACFEGFIVLAKKRYFRVLRFDRSR